MLSASRGKSRIAFSFASGVSGLGSSPTNLWYSWKNAGSLKLLRRASLMISTRSLGMAGGRMNGEPVKLKLRNIVTILRSRSVFAVNFRQIGKLRVFIFSWHSEDNMEIDETLFQPFRLAIQQPTVGYGDGIDLTTHQSDSPLRIRKAGDIPNFFEPEEPSHDPADVVVAMANGLSTQTYARGLPKLFDGCQSGLTARQKHIVSGAVRRANEVKFV